MSVWMADPWRAKAIRSDLNEALWWALKGAGITIPLPQRDVHVRTLAAPALEAVRAL